MEVGETPADEPADAPGANALPNAADAPAGAPADAPPDAAELGDGRRAPVPSQVRPPVPVLEAHARLEEEAGYTPSGAARNGCCFVLSGLASTNCCDNWFGQM